MSWWHAGEEDSGLLWLHVFLNPFEHVLHRHPVGLLCTHLLNFLHLIFEGPFPEHRQPTICQQEYAKKGKSCLIHSDLKMLSRTLQNPHLVATHPPDVCVEDHDISAFPVLSMRVYWVFANNSVGYPVFCWIVRVWFKQQRRPVELNSCIVIL